MDSKELKKRDVLSTRQSLPTIKSIPPYISSFGIKEVPGRIQNLLEKSSSKEAANDPINLNLTKTVSATYKKVGKLIRQKLEDWNISCNEKTK